MVSTITKVLTQWDQNDASEPQSTENRVECTWKTKVKHSRTPILWIFSGRNPKGVAVEFMTPSLSRVFLTAVVYRVQTNPFVYFVNQPLNCDAVYMNGGGEWVRNSWEWINKQFFVNNLSTTMCWGSAFCVVSKRNH